MIRQDKPRFMRETKDMTPERRQKWFRDQGGSKSLHHRGRGYGAKIGDVRDCVACGQPVTVRKSHLHRRYYICDECFRAYRRKHRVA